MAPDIRNEYLTLDEYIQVIKKCYTEVYGGSAKADTLWHPEDLGANMSAVIETISAYTSESFAIRRQRA